MEKDQNSRRTKKDTKDSWKDRIVKVSIVSENGEITRYIRAGDLNLI